MPSPRHTLSRSRERSSAPGSQCAGARRHHLYHDHLSTAAAAWLAASRASAATNACSRRPATGATPEPAGIAKGSEWRRRCSGKIPDYRRRIPCGHSDRRTTGSAEGAEATEEEFVSTGGCRIQRPSLAITFAAHSPWVQRNEDLPMPPEQTARESLSLWRASPARTRSPPRPGVPPNTHTLPRKSAPPRPDPPEPANFARRKPD